MGGACRNGYRAMDGHGRTCTTATPLLGILFGGSFWKTVVVVLLHTLGLYEDANEKFKVRRVQLVLTGAWTMLYVLAIVLSAVKGFAHSHVRLLYLNRDFSEPWR